MVQRRRPGDIRDAVLSVLRDAGGEASVSDIHRGVRELRGPDVAPSSVRSCLRLSSLFTQTKRGRYRLSDG